VGIEVATARSFEKKLRKGKRKQKQKLSSSYKPLNEK